MISLEWVGLDLVINVSSDCSFDFHISNLVKRTKHLTGWIPRNFTSCDKLTILTLFKALVMSRLDYGCQLWPPYLITLKGPGIFTVFHVGVDLKLQIGM